MKQQHLRLILNGKSAGRSDVRKAVETVRSMGHEVSVRVTYEAGDTQRLTREALIEAGEGDIDTVVCGGGDGTLHEVADTVVGKVTSLDRLPFSLAVLPLGTANDFAHGIGLDPADVLSCLRFCVRASARPMDLGSVNGKAFVNMATGGFGTKVTSQTDPGLKKLLGGAAYLFTGLNRFSELAASEGRIEADDGFVWEGAFFALAVGNGRRAGGGVVLCPQARLDDGLLDLTVIPAPSANDMPELLKLLLERGVDGLREQAISRRSSAVTIETEQPLQMNLDGEPVHGTRFEISCLPGRVLFRR